ncbi:MAG: PAS domain S-box protein, partial [Ignavibacteria bacterium]|nr:PAS domain S-box protein [Ignavibacteria bacterium]
RKRMEEELQILSSRQSAILASVPDIIMEVDNNKVYRWANVAGVKYFGDDVVGKEAAFYFEGEQDTYVNVEPLFNGDENTIYVESWQRRRDGERRLLAWWCKVLKDRNGEVTGALSTARDVTERKRAENALNDSRENLYLLLNSMAEGAYGVDNNGNCTFVNRAFLQILGYQNENELIGRDIHKLIHHSHCDGSPYPSNECRMYHAHITKKAITASDEVFWRKDGVPIPIEYWVHPIVKEGEVIGSIATFINITERKNFDLIRNAVFKISQAADKIMSLEELYKSIHEIISTIMHAKNFYISMYDERINTISFPYSVDEKDISRSERPFGNGLTEYVLRKGKALLVNSEQILEMSNKGEIVQSGTLSAIWLGVPLTIDDKAIGVMAVQHYSDSKAYGERELRMLEYISSQVARTIERKRAEEKIKILSSAVENAYESFVLTDINGNISYANEFAYKTFGLSPNELLEMKLAHLSANHEEVEKILNEVVSTENYNGDIILTKKNSEAFPAALNVSLIKDAAGVPSGMMCIIHDVTEREQAEQEIISQKERFSQLFENSPIAIVLLDEQDKIIQINESFTQLFDYYPDEIKGKYINNLIASPEMKEEAESYSAQVRQGNQFNKESYRIKKDGTSIYVQIVGIPITLNGRIVGMYGMYLDMTQRKEAEDKLKLAKELAEQSAKMKTEFLAQMSHEIRTPLNVITANVDYLKEEVRDKIESESLDCFEFIELSSQRIIRTIDLILNMTEIQLGLFKPILTKVNLDTQVLSKLYHDYLKLASNKGIGLVYNCDVKKPEIEVDEYCIVQIISNLIDNAIKFTREGKVEILLTRNCVGDFIIEVKDTGIGIGKDFLSQLFQPFMQEDHGYARSYEGNGLGLALAKSYCDINNAVLEVESKKNIGSTFRVILGNK